MKRSYCSVVAILWIFLTGHAWADYPETSFLPDAVKKNVYFGYATAIQGNYAAVGGYTKTTKIFKLQGGLWIENATLSTSDITAATSFGCALSMDGDYLVIGARADDEKATKSGAAYIFKRNGETWVQQVRLTPQAPPPYDFNEALFGYRVSISGDYAVIGSPQESSDDGAAYVFKRDGNTWTQQVRLTSAKQGDRFGSDVAIDDNTIVVGAPWSGFSAYIFEQTGGTWAQTSKLNFSGGGVGYSVDINGDTAAISAHQESPKGENSGVVYIVKRNQTGEWIQKVKLYPDDGAAGDAFGRDLKLFKDMLLIGAAGFYNDGKGSAYLYQQEGEQWVLQKKLTASDGAAKDRFGYSLSLSDSHLILGAPYKTTSGASRVGKAYFYKYQESPAQIVLNPDTPSPAIGDTLCVDVNIAGTTGLYSSAFDLTFDPAALQFLNASQGDFLNSDSGATFFEAALLNGEQSSGIVVMGASRVGDIGLVSGSGTIATACFSVVGSGGGTTTVGIDNGYFEGADSGTGIDIVEGDDPVIPIGIGVVTNQAVTDPGTRDRLDLSWDPAADATGYEVYRSAFSDGTFELLGTTTDPAYQDSNCILTGVAYYYKLKAVSAGGGTGEFSDEASGTAAGLHGDINKDNRIDGRDLTILARAYNTDPGDGRYNCQANLNRTGGIDGDDFVTISTGFGDQL